MEINKKHKNITNEKLKEEKDIINSQLKNYTVFMKSFMSKPNTKILENQLYNAEEKFYEEDKELDNIFSKFCKIKLLREKFREKKLLKQIKKCIKNY